MRKLKTNTTFGRCRRAWWVDLDALAASTPTPEELLIQQEEEEERKKVWHRQDWTAQEKRLLDFLFQDGENFSGAARRLGITPAAINKLVGRMSKKAQGPEQLALF